MYDRKTIAKKFLKGALIISAMVSWAIIWNNADGSVAFDGWFDKEQQMWFIKTTNVMSQTKLNSKILKTLSYRCFCDVVETAIDLLLLWT